MAIYVKESPDVVPLESSGLVGTTGTASIVGGVQKDYLIRSFPHVAMTEEQVLAVAEASTLIPSAYNAKFCRRKIKVQERRAFYAYVVRATYTAPGSGSGGSGTLVNRTFQSVNTTAHVTVAWTETVYGATASFDNAIHVVNGEAKGADIDAGYSQMTEIHHKPASVMTDNYINTICMNFANKCICNAAFRMFAAHEVRLNTFDIGQAANGIVPVTFTFLVGANLTNQTIAGVPGVNKNAHDIVWPAGQPQISNGWMGPGYTSVVVNRVYPEISFAFIDTNTAT